jgi:O-antigen ligase
VLIGRAAGDQVGSYGPRLIGEPSSAGTGTFFAFAAALALAAYRARLMRTATAVVLFVGAAACAYLAESRTALVSIIGLTGLFVVQSRPGRLGLPSRIAVATAAGSLAIWYVLRNHTERLSISGLNRGAEDRLRDIWAPIVDRAADDPLLLALGVGPGGLPDPALPITEAHNIVLRAWLDFGLVGGTLFLAALVVVGVSAYRVSRDARRDPFTALYAELVALYALAVAITGVALDSLTTVTSTHLLMMAAGLFAGASAESGPAAWTGPVPNGDRVAAR